MLYLLVAVPFALNLPEYIDTVVVPKCSAHLVVIHRQMVLLYAPESGETGRIDDLEYTGLPALPRNVVSISLRGVVQQLLQEVPEKSAVCK